MINLGELKYNQNGEIYNDGYRIVYFYSNGKCSIGAYCKTIEGFMIGLSDYDPIVDEDDIPPYISNEDLLNRCLKFAPTAQSVAIYKVDGTCIQKIEKA